MRTLRSHFLLGALLLAACGDAPEPVLRPDQMRVVKVRGDAQTGPVSGTSAAVADRAIRMQVAPASGPDLLPEPLVARITGEGAARALGPTGPSFSVGHSGGPSFAKLPANASVTFRVVDEGPNACGRSFVDSAIPDDSAYVTTYWERPTRAGTCQMEARLIVDGRPVVDEVFTAIFEPGPMKNFYVQGASVGLGDTIDMRRVVTGAADQHGNPISAETIQALPSSRVSWGWYDYQIGARTAGPIATGTGWLLRAPAAMDTTVLTPRRREFVRDAPDPRGHYFDALEYIIQARIHIDPATQVITDIRAYYCLDGSPVASHANGCP